MVVDTSFKNGDKEVHWVIPFDFFFFFLLIFEALLNAEISTTDYMMNGYLTKSTQKLGGIEAERYLLGVEI